VKITKKDLNLNDAMFTKIIFINANTDEVKQSFKQLPLPLGRSTN